MATYNPNTLYSAIASIYDIILWVVGYKLAVGYFIRLLPFPRERQFTVLDAGCGTVLYTFALLKHFPNAKITAFDVNEGMAATMKSAVQRKGLDKQVTNIFIGDVTKPLPLPINHFDIIVTGGVLEYVSVGDAVQNLAPHL